MKKSTKIVSIILAIVMVISAIPFFSFAAAPSLTASASKTADIKAGDEVTVTVMLSKNSGLGTLAVELNYDGTAFKVESATAGSLFQTTAINKDLTNKVKFIAVSGKVVNDEGAVFTVKFKALKAADSTMTLKIAEATDDDYNNVTVTTNTLSFKGDVEPTTEESTTQGPIPDYNSPYITLSTNKKEVKSGDEVTVTVKLSKDSGLYTLIVELNYDGAAFKVESATAGTLFGNDFINSGLTNKVKFVAASTNVVNAEGTVFTVKFKALKAADSTMTLKILEATDDDYNNVTVTTNTLSFKGDVEVPSETPSETPSEKPSETPSEPEDPCRDGHNYSDSLVVKMPTCKEAGLKNKVCKRCGDKIEESIPATGECVAGAWEVVKPATTTAEGEKVQRCKYCGEVLQRAKIAKLPSDEIVNPTIPSTDEDENFFIQEPSRTTLRNKDGIILHINPDVALPKGAYIEWQYKNSNFQVEEAENGMKLIAVAEKKGWTVFTATVYDVDGNILAKDSVELYSKSGLFDKVAGFFRSIFGATKIYEN